MGKSVVWIDDNVNVMKEVVSYVFPNLWEKDIKSYICITNKAEKSVEHLNRIIYDQFVSYIIDKDYIYDDKIVVQKEKLVKTLTATEDTNKDTPTADIAVNISDLFEKYQHQISKIYKNIASDDAENISSENKKKENADCYSINNLSDESEKFTSFPKNFIEEMTKYFTNDFTNDITFGIDLCLLDGDYEILKEKQDTSILSMVLYDSLMKQHITAFLYTTHYVPNNIIDGWKYLYSRFFKLETEKIDFYNRRGMNVSQSENPNELIELITGAKK